MLTVSFIITMALAGTVFVAVNRWQAGSGDRQRIDDRARTLEVLGRIVEQHADTNVDTDQGRQSRPADVQRRLARPLPAAFNVLGTSDMVVRSSPSPRVTDEVTADVTADIAAWAPSPSASRMSRPVRRDVRPDHRTDDTIHRHVMRLPIADLSDDHSGLDHYWPTDSISDTRSMDQPAPPSAGDAVTPLSRRPQSSPKSHTKSRTPSHTPSHAPRRRRLATAAAAIAVVAAVGLASTWNSDGPSPYPATTADAASTAPLPPEVPEAAPSLPLTPGLVVGDVAAFEVAAPFTLDLAADQPSWVQVRNRSGQVLFEQTLQPGESTQVDVDQPVAVRTGNPAGLAVTAGFVPLDHPRPAGQPITLHLG
jgi:hypothetical protein